MKILVAAASFTSGISGLERHALNLARCLLSQPEITSVFFVVAPWQRALLDAAKSLADPRLVTYMADMERSAPGRNLWYYRRLPRLAALMHVDLVHLAFPMPVNAAAFSCPTVVTLHDLYPCEIPMNFGFPKFHFNRMVLGQCLRNVDAIACVSNATRMQLHRYYPAASDKAVRIHNCVEAEDLSAEETPVAGWHGECFLLSIAQHRRNKNVPLLIRSFHRLLHSGRIGSTSRLAVVGIDGPETRALHQLVAHLGLQHSVRFLKGLPEAELQWFYRHCEALVAPSITEGFGLPIAEGLLAGCRIVCSDIPPHREIGGEHCTFVALGADAEEVLAAAVHAALRKPKPQPIALPQLSVPILAKEYIALYCRLIESRAADRVATPSMALAGEERRPS